MNKAKEYLNTMPHWQYIKFDYNKDNVEVVQKNCNAKQLNSLK